MPSETDSHKHFTVRLASAGDAAELAGIFEELGYRVTQGALEARMLNLGKSDEHAVFVSVVGGRVAGSLHVCKLNSLLGGARAEIHSLVVTSTERGKGQGKALVNAAIEWARGVGLPVIRVGTRMHRADAHAFYERLGFSLVKEHRIYEASVP